MDNEQILQYIKDVRAESEEGRRERIQKNRVNREAYDNKQDWSHKVEGQSKEFIPKVSETVEQFSAFIRKGLTQFGDWFTPRVSDEAPLSDSAVRKLMRRFLENLHTQEGKMNFSVVLGDAVKTGLLESLMIFKVHGTQKSEKVYVERGEEVVLQEFTPWRLQIDVIPPEDYYPDPTRRNLYEVHRVERDLHHVQALSQGEDPIYDPKVVAQIQNDMEKELKEAGERRPGEDRAKPSFRKSVVLDEFWGTILNFDGSVFKENVLMTMANDKYLIRAPIDNPFWHNESPFVSTPLIRVPFTVWHRALYDQVVPLNLALNELFNLMLDGGIASVWGIKQIRLDYLDDPSQVSEGIAQGKTLAVKEETPDGMKVLEQVTEGQIPPDAMAMYNLIDKEYNASAKTNELKLGNLPSKQVKATEIMEVSQSQASELEAITNDIESFLENLLRKAWLTILQHIDSVPIEEFNQVLTTKELFRLATTPPSRRFATMANGSSFKVDGLSQTLSRAREFQKLMALLQVASNSPVLLPALVKRVSPDKLLLRAMKMLNINPDDLGRDEKDLQDIPDQLAFLQNSLQGQGQNAASGGVGESGLPSEINQEANPSEI